MVTSTSGAARYETVLTNGHARSLANTVKGGVGGVSGFRPHELLEGALAACMNISVRMRADDLGLGPITIRVEVSLDRSEPSEAFYCWSLDLDGSLTDAQREILEEAASRCAVGQTLQRLPVFVKTSPLPRPSVQPPPSA